MSNDGSSESVEEQHNFDAYLDYAKTLRAWFIAYGVGAPVLFLTKKEVADKLAQSPSKDLIVYLFLVGVCLQILISLANKWGNWYVYAFKTKSSSKETKPYKFAHWFIYQFWIDIVCDVGSAIAFGLATVKVLFVLL